MCAIEGIGTYGAILSNPAGEAGYTVAEAAELDAKSRHSAGKDDRIDACRIAAAILPLDQSRLRTPREADGVRQALRVFVKARESMTVERTRNVNALTGLARANDLGIDARKKLSLTTDRTIAKWRARREPIAVAEARREATPLAHRVCDLDGEIKDYYKRIHALAKASPAAAPLAEPGIGPIPASSGNTIRYRLNRSGDRRLNSAMHLVIITRLKSHEQTRGYMLKRLGQGKTKKETIRCLKRYLARSVYRLLESTNRLEIAA